MERSSLHASASGSPSVPASAPPRALALVWVGLVAGCPPQDDQFVGNPDLPVEAELVHRTVDGRVAPCQEGGDVPIMTPPQGGKVVFVGVRARNLDVRGVKLTASLRDECTNRILALEQRPVNLVETEDGWAEPERPAEISNYSNLAVCPTEAASRDVDGTLYLLKVSIEDRDGRTAEETLRVRPVCAEPGLEEQCACQCDADYVLGGECPSDAMPDPPECS